MSGTPPWAKRMEQKIDCLKEKEVLSWCYFHTLHGEKADRCSNPPCDFNKIKKVKSNNMVTSSNLSLSPVVQSMLAYMKPMKMLSPIKDCPMVERKARSKSKTKKSSLKEDIVEI